MKIIIRKLENKEREYFAYLKSLNGKATFMLYFSDDIYGAISLNNFAQMLKEHFEETRVDIILQDEQVKLTNKAVLSILDMKVE